jgi:hypothetical protein
MDSFLKRQAGAHAQLWDMVVADVFRPLGIVYAPMIHTQEVDGRRGIPLLSVGLYPTIDDVAKLTPSVRGMLSTSVIKSKRCYW